MHVFYDTDNGSVQAVYNAPTDDIITAKSAQGLAFIEADWPDNAEREDYLVQDGALIEKPEPSEAERREAIRSAAIGDVIKTTQRFIAYKPDGRVRYDGDFKINGLEALFDALQAGDPLPSAVMEVKGWISAVKQAYFQKRQALAAATDLAGIEAVDISYQWFEERYGVAGTVLPDPDKSTKDFTNPA